MEFIKLHYMEILIVLLAVSELLAYIPSIKANSVFQLVVGFIKGFLAKKDAAK